MYKVEETMEDLEEPETVEAGARKTPPVRLTPKQEAFCLSYAETGNALEAYRRVYGKENMKDATVERNAKKWWVTPT